MIDIHPHSYDWNDIEKMLNEKIEVWYVKDAQVNRKREEQKSETIKWIIDSMREGVRSGGMIDHLPEFAWTFGDLWNPISTAMRMRYPLCMICHCKPTMEIHHVRPKFLRGSNDPRNLIALCKECHDEVHRRIDKGITKALDDALRWNNA